MSRLAELSYDDMTPDQRRVHDDIIAGPRGHIGGPMNAWFRSPAYADLVQKLGAFCRYETALGRRLSELTILIVARHWKAQVEWCVHKPLAIEAGVAPAAIDAIEAGRAPDFARDDEAALYAFCFELIETRAVGDEVYAAALAVFGEQTLVELIGLLGYYTSTAMILNAFQVPPPTGVGVAAPL